MKPHKRQDRTIVLHFASHNEYLDIIDSQERFRQHIMAQYAQYPELFPIDLSFGFHLHGFITSKKMGIRQRRIRLKANKEVYQVRPSHVLSYMTATLDQVEHILSLRQWAVPFWKLAELGGKSAMFWYRLYLSLGRYSIVGATVKHSHSLPESLIADEKHTKRYRQKAYIATTVAKGCILGAALTDYASEANLREAYEIFALEAQALDADYAPQSVTLDGWEATNNSWHSLYSGIVVILCFLHGWLSIKKRCKRQKELLKAVGDRVWDVYGATTKRSFGQRMRRLKEWTVSSDLSGWAKEKVLRLCEKAEQYKKGLLIEGSPRTSNGLDRLMDHQDRQLYAMRTLHSNDENGELMVRAIAQMWNFHGYGPRTMSENPGREASPFEGINGFSYHPNWLQNFNIASSLQRRYSSHKIR